MSEITTTARRIARSVNKAPSYRALAFDGDGRLVEVWQAGQTRPTMNPAPFFVCQGSRVTKVTYREIQDRLDKQALWTSVAAAVMSTKNEDDLTVAQYAARRATTPDKIRDLIRAGDLRADVLNPKARRPTYRLSEAAIRQYEARSRR